MKKSHGEGWGNKTPEYKAWQEMKRRCNDSNRQNYRNYGGRGIVVCERWLDFTNFLADMGRKPTLEHSLDRYPNNNGNYEPGNVRWATKEQQSRNRRTNTLLTFQGKTLCIIEWSELTGLRAETIEDRLHKYKWSIEDTLTKPIKNRRWQEFIKAVSAGENK